MGRKKVLQIVKDVDEEENRCCGFLWSKGSSSSNSNKSADDSATDMISLRDIFKFSTTRDYVYVTLGFIGAILTGQGWAVNSILFGWIVDVLLKYELNRDILNNSTDFRVLPSQSGNQTMEGVESEFMDTIWFITYISFALSIAFSAGTYIAMYYFQKFSVRQVQIIMERYFTQILRQDISWFDKQNSGEFASRISGDLKKFEHGINENLAMLLYNITGALFNLGASFFFGWKLTLAILTVIPFIIVGSIAMARLQSYYIQKEVQTASAASTVAEETISAIRTVFAFGGEKKEAERYDHELAPGLGHAIKRNIATAIGNSINWGMMYVALAIGIFYGVKLVLAAPDSHTPGDIIIIFWCVNGISYNVAYAAPHYEALQIGRTAAANIFRIIAQKSRIDSSSIVGERLSGGHKNDIEFKNVHFSYPTRPNIPILQGLNLKINSGEIVALVGASGCGKSTIIQLIQRFYDPSIGEVLLDGTNLRELNVGWLREQIGVVGQEPVLFDDSIEQNIRLGLPQDKIDVASMDDIIEAAKEANAHDFISKLPSTYDTYVGDRGTQLSGGQKQRIAIARALISHPKILLLDEATSALDLQSEQVVQAALDRASLGRTTVIVAHRLSTIINADRIVFFEGGKVLEEGTHEELMSKKSAYYGLVKAQEIAIASDVSDGEEKKTAEQHQPPPSKPAEQEMERYRTGTFNLPNLSARMKSLSFSSVNSFNGSALQYSGIEDFEELAQASKEKFPYARFGRLIWQDKWMFMTAFVCALGFGLATPIYAVILGDFVDEFRHPDAYDEKVMIPKAIYYTLGFILLAIIVFVINVAQISLFGIISEKLTLRLRQQAYAAILNQDIAWFDNSENSTGALCSRLTNDAANIQGATGLRISMMCQCASTLVASVAIGFFYSWQLALVGVVLMPVIALSSIASAEIYSSQAAHAGQSAQRSVKVVIEVMNSIRTVVSLHKENYFFANFTSSLTEHSRYVESKMWIKAVVMAIAVSSQMWAYTAAFLAGGYVMISGGIRSGDFFRVVESMIFGACVIGESAILSSDFARAKLAALSIFKLIDRQPMKMLEESGQGKIEKLEQDRAQGNIQFRGIRFAYPSRPEQTILDGLSFSAEKGQTVALVGSSGCGKSTSIQLLEQFYTPSKGKIYLDGEGIHHLDRDWARRQMALVSQEPILFSYSIAQNIAYGDNSRHVPFDEIVRAAQLANVSDFIKKLPQGYDTPVGSKGTQLSGGQKQRIAIARALIRDPPILLLDEATSALDTASESVVQKALEEAAKGRTCLVIAHRLKTIVNAHKIVVLHKGQAVEEGTHSELLDLKGHYWRLYNSAVGAQES